MTDLWNYLKTASKPILLYGMGDGADKIISVLNRYGIKISGVFASDGFVREKTFHGFKVTDYKTAKQIFGDMVVLVCFGSSLPDVIANIKRIATEQELYAPDVPVCGEELFDLDFFNAHRDEIDRVYRLLADEESKEIYESVIKYKLSGDIRYLKSAVSDRDTVWQTLVGEVQTAADLGAYNGDTLREIKPYAQNLKSAIAFEPEW
jgi:hypothetical protein